MRQCEICRMNNAKICKNCCYTEEEMQSGKKIKITVEIDGEKYNWDSSNTPVSHTNDQAWDLYWMANYYAKKYGKTVDDVLDDFTRMRDDLVDKNGKAGADR